MAASALSSGLVEGGVYGGGGILAGGVRDAVILAATSDRAEDDHDRANPGEGNASRSIHTAEMYQAGRGVQRDPSVRIEVATACRPRKMLP